MKTFKTLLLSLAVLGACAKPQSNVFQSNGFNGAFSPLPVVNTHIQTPIVENPTVDFPIYVPPTTISESCHHLKTLVRPQIRNEIITVPTIDRIVRTVSPPVVETMNNNAGSRMAAVFTGANNLLSAIVAGSNNRRNSGGLPPNETNQGSTATNQNNGATSSKNEIDVDLIARPTFFTIQTAPARISNTFTGNSGTNGIQDSTVMRK